MSAYPALVYGELRHHDGGRCQKRHQRRPTRRRGEDEKAEPRRKQQQNSTPTSGRNIGREEERDRTTEKSREQIRISDST